MATELNTMLKYLIFLQLMCFICLGVSGRQLKQQGPELYSSFTDIIVKKRNAGKICDTCFVDFALSALPEFTYMITGAGHTPVRFSRLRRNFNSSNRKTTFQSDLFYISRRNIGICFLPNFEQDKDSAPNFTEILEEIAITIWNLKQNGTVVT